MMPEKRAQKLDTGNASDWLNQISHVARPMWVVMHHQYGISVLVSQTSFCGETSGRVAKCRLFSQVIRVLTESQN